MSRVTIYRLELLTEGGDVERWWGYCGKAKQGRRIAAEDLHVPLARIRATPERVQPHITPESAGAR